jgi:hypothetical protein
VATRLAHKALVAAARRRRRERAAAVPEQVETDDGSVRQWLDHELAGLPEGLRLPVVLCLLEGHSQDEAAARLGWRPRTLKARLQRGKEALRRRLERRGLPAGLPALAVGEPVRLGLRESTVRLAVLFAHGAAPEGAAVTLAGVGLRLLAWSRLQVLAAVLLVAGLVGLGTGLLLNGPRGVAAPGEAKPAAGKDLHGDPLPPGAVARLGTLRFRHPSWGIIDVAVTADGETIVTAGTEHDVCVWEMSTGRLLRRFPTGDLYARALALSPGGQLVALAGRRWVDNTVPTVGTVQLRNAFTGQVVRALEVKDERIDYCSLAFSPDGKLLASLTDTGVLRLTEVATGTDVLREYLHSYLIE